MQRTFVTQNSLATNPTTFTAKNIIDHITANCTCDNSKSVIQIKNGISALIKYKGQDLISWFQTFQPPVTRYRKAIGIGVGLNEAELKALWKEHFAKQITRRKNGDIHVPSLALNSWRHSQDSQTI